ncbi:diguanylate cyclase domain-containing protein [Geminicoccus roseus]|uniref:diguanylate cyclase domain-containing protein n=1 Tax=Geminicoccus roseus TaxID=404900 RepID=UPI0004898FBF|nr:diguanylate cyclase [Geminicoccus roseus]
MSSIRVRLALVVLLALLPALGLTLHGAWQDRAEHLEQGGQRLLQAALLVAEEHEQLEEGARQLLLALGTSPVLEGDDMAACRERLAEVLADAAGRYANVRLFGPNSRMICDGRGTGWTEGPDGQLYAQEAQAGGLAIGARMAVHDAAGRPVLPISMPLEAAPGQPARILVADLSLDWMAAHDERLERPEGAALVIEDTDGHVLVAHGPGSRSEGAMPRVESGTGPRIVSAAGRLVGLAPAAGGVLKVAVSLPEAEVTAAADRVLRIELVAGVLALLLGSGLAAAFAEIAVARRLRALTRFATRLRDGDLAARPVAGQGGDELEELARELGVMAGQLEWRVGELAASEALQRHRARHDELTGLPNRRGLGERLSGELAAARRHQGALALLLLDLDHFKEVNDRLGHATGDALLAAAANRMRAVLREEDMVARLGGDEFAVLLVGRGGPFSPETTAQRLVEALARPFSLEDQEVRSGASLGIALFPEHGAAAQELFVAADRALYAAKQAGRATWRTTDRMMSGKAGQRQETSDPA